MHSKSKSFGCLFSTLKKIIIILLVQRNMIEHAWLIKSNSQRGEWVKKEQEALLRGIF